MHVVCTCVFILGAISCCRGWSQRRSQMKDCLEHGECWLAGFSRFTEASSNGAFLFRPGPAQGIGSHSCFSPSLAQPARVVLIMLCYCARAGVKGTSHGVHGSQRTCAVRQAGLKGANRLNRAATEVHAGQASTCFNLAPRRPTASYMSYLVEAFHLPYAPCVH